MVGTDKQGESGGLAKIKGTKRRLEQFLGSLIHDVGRTVSKVAHTVSNVASAIDKVVPVSSIAKGIGSVVSGRR